MKVVVSIVSYNSREYLKDLLLELQKQKTKHELEIVVVDNKSPDSSNEMLEKEFKNITLIKSSENGGFAKGHNQALKRMNTDFALLLNPDIRLGDTGAIDKLIDFMLENPDCGISSSKLIGPEGHLQSNGGDFPFGIALISWLFNLESIAANLPNFHRTDSSYYKKTHLVDWVGGTVMVIRKEVFEKIGYLNEDIFMYFEDTEFCYRAKKAGFKIRMNPHVNIGHIGGASSEDPQFRQWSGEYKGLIYFYKKYFGRPRALMVRILVYIAISLRIIAFTLLGKFFYSKTYIKVFGALQ